MSIKNLSEIVKAMMAAGCSLEQVNAVLDVHVKADEEAQLKKRDKWKNDKRRQRMSTDVHQDDSGHAKTQVDEVDLPSLNGSPPTLYIRNIDTPPSLNPPINNRHSALFDAFWKAYPRKVGKGAAQKAWAVAVRKADPDRIIEGVERYPWPDDPAFVPHASTWLNGQRWEDELPGMKPRKLSQAELDEQERKRIEFLKEFHRRAGRVSEAN